MESSTIGWVAGGGVILFSLGLVASSIYDFVMGAARRKHA